MFLLLICFVFQAPVVANSSIDMRKPNLESCENTFDENLKTILSTTPNIGTANTLMVTFDNALGQYPEIKRFNEIVQIKKGFKLKYVRVQYPKRC